MGNKILSKCLILVLMASFVLMGAFTTEAQRGQHMMGPHQDQRFDEREEAYGYGTMGPGMHMMGPGTGMAGMMGPGMGMTGFGMGMAGPGMGMMGFMSLPDLTDQQQGEMLSLQQQARREHMELMLDIMEIRDELLLLMSEERPDPQEVRKLQEAMSQKQADMTESSLEVRNKMYELLTEEQRNQLRMQQYGPRRW